jgi:hypothetical protein
MPDLKFAGLFSGVDQLSDKLSSIVGTMGKLTGWLIAGGDHIHEIGERMVEWGKRVGAAAAILSEGADKLAEVKEQTIAFANTHPGVTGKEWAAGFTRMRGVFQDTASSMKATGVAGMLSRSGVDNEAPTRLITASWSNLRSDAKIESMVNRLVTSSQQGKVAIDFSLGLTAGLEQLNRLLRGTGLEKIGELNEMGVSNPEAMLALIENLDEVAAKQKEIAASASALGQAFGIATAEAADQVKLPHQNVSNVSDSIYSPALPTINRWLGDLTGAACRAAGAAEHRLSIARYAAPSLPAVGRPAYYGFLDFSSFGTMTAFANKGIEALSKFADWQSISLRGVYAWDKLKSINAGIASFGSALEGAIPSIMSFGATLLANPLIRYVASAAVPDAAAYEIYVHWDVAKAFLIRFWERIKAAWSGVVDWVVKLFGTRREEIKHLFSETADWMTQDGANLVKALGEGILSGIEWPMKAAEHLAERIGGFSHFHSPLVYGPLRDAVVNFHFGKELEKRFQVVPVATAAERTAQIVATPLASPVVVAGEGQRGSGRGIREAGGVTVNYSPTITINENAAAPREEFAKTLQQHSRDLVRIIKDHDFRERRLRFDD